MAGKPQPKVTITCGCGHPRTVAAHRVGAVERCEGCQRDHRASLRRARATQSTRAAEVERVRRWRLENPEKWVAQREAYAEEKRQRDREKNAQQRAVILAAYGHACVCCGTTFAPHLVLDHVNDDGAEERKRLGAGNVYAHVIDAGFPPSYQLLCWNCNMTKHYQGRCPCADQAVRLATG